MFDARPIVVGIDFSPGSEAALVRAADLAERSHGTLHLLHATAIFHSEYGGVQVSELPASTESQIRDFAASALGSEDALEVIGPTIVVRRGEAPADALARYASAVDAGLVVVGTHGRRGLRHLVMGSVAEEVVRVSPTPVLTIPMKAARTAPSPTAAVLVPVDFSTISPSALVLAKAFAGQYGAPVDLVHVVPEPGPTPGFYHDMPGLFLMDDVRTSLDEQTEAHTAAHLWALDEEVGGEPARAAYVRFGRPDQEIVALAADTTPGLILMATHGLSGIEHLLLGSVTERTLRAASCPVLSFKEAVLAPAE